MTTKQPNIRKPKPAPAFQDDAPELPPAISDGSIPAEEFVDRRGDIVLSAREPEWLKYRSGSVFAADITARYGRIKDEFLTIGRMLNHAKEVLAHGEFLPMLESSLPFGEDTAQQLMAVARAVDSHRVPMDRLPAAYTVAYQLVSLKKDDLIEAEKAGLLRPDLTRGEIIDFKRKRRVKEHAVFRESEIASKLGRLIERRNLLDKEIATLKKELADFEQLADEPG